MSYLNCTESEHYLDDFVLILEATTVTTANLESYKSGYKLLTDCLGIPRQETKDRTGTVVPVFGIKIDTNLFEAQIPEDELNKAIRATGDALTKGSLALHEAQSLTGFLSFCAQVVQLGWVFMRKLWDFVAAYPVACSHFSKRRISSEVYLNLQWWNKLLPMYNGIRFFDIETRKTVQLYTDASLLGLGGFYYQDNIESWSNVAYIAQEHAFAAPIINSSHINTHELEAILLAMKAWGNHWARTKLIVLTDSATAFNGLIRNTLRGTANSPLWENLLLAAKHDIKIIPHWIPSHENGLADALSRFNVEVVANLCPYWQAPWSSLLLPWSL